MRRTVRVAAGGLFALPRAKLTPVAGARGTIAVAVPLVLGAATGQLAAGIAAVLGAYLTGFADLTGPYRRRLRVGLVVAGAGAVSVVLGSVTTSPALGVPVVALWGFGAGMLVALGPTGTRVGTTAMILLIALGEQPQDLRHGVLAALAVLLGGALQAVVAAAPWPVRGHAPERRALAEAYERLADVETGGRLPADDVLPALLGMHAALRGVDPARSRVAASLRILLDEAERIRTETVALGALADRLDRAGRTDVGTEVRDLLVVADLALAGVATALRHPVGGGRGVRAGAGAGTAAAAVVAGAPEYDLLAASVDRLRARADAPGPAALTLRAAAARASALAGQVRAATRIATAVDPRPDARTVTPPAVTTATDDPLGMLRANLRPSSSVFRHAVRLAVSLALTAAALAVLGLPRGYWLLLTVAVVLRADFSATIKQVTERIAGTLLGTVLVSLLLEYALAETWQRIALVPVSYFLLRTVLAANFALSAVAISGNAVLLVTLLGAPTGPTIVERAVYTLVGGAIGLAAYLAWPTWERTSVRGTLADGVEAARRYLGAVTEADAGVGDIAAARTRARVALTDARAAVRRLRDEPGSPDELVGLAEGVVAHASRLLQGGLALEAARTARGGVSGEPSVAVFTRDLDAALATVADAVRDGRRPAPLPPLRQDVEAIVAVAPRARLAGLVEAADRLTDGVDTLDHLLRTADTPRP